MRHLFFIGVDNLDLTYWATGMIDADIDNLSAYSLYVTVLQWIIICYNAAPADMKDTTRVNDKARTRDRVSRYINPVIR